jgi:hypothetical protein
MINIGWTARGTQLEFQVKLGKKLVKNFKDRRSFYVCHTKSEKEVIANNYGEDAWALGDYFYEKEKSYTFKEEKIEELQKKYNFFPLKRLTWSEAYEKNYSESELNFKLLTHFSFWEEFIETNEITHMVSEMPSIMSTSVLWVVCKKLGVNFISFGDWCLDKKLIFNDKFGCEVLGLEENIEIFKHDKSSENYKYSVDYLKKMQFEPERPTYLSFDPVTGKKIDANGSFSSPTKGPRIPSIKKIIQILLEPYNDYYLSNPNRPKSYKRWILANIRSLLLKFVPILEKNVDPKNEKFFLFPLHILREWADYSWMGLKYPNIENVIKECAASLPMGYKLYVKEHPSHFPEKSYFLYRSLNKISNVKLIDPKENNFELIKKSSGIITLGSTMGWEAFLLGIKVFVLVDIWYAHLPGVYKANTVIELTELLQKNQALKPASDEEKLKAIGVIYDLSFDGVLYPLPALNKEENIENFYKAFNKYFEGNWVEL